jgi:GH24 family phage-related lysozyme (muramidase)
VAQESFVIRPSVLALWHDFSEPLEGRVAWPYLDVRGLVTVGVGALIDPIGLALQLPWRIDGRVATPAEVFDEWSRVKAMPRGRVAAAYRGALRLAERDIDALTERRLEANAGMLRGTFRDFAEWPADAQLGALSRAWAAGASLAKWPKHREACRARDWGRAAKESHLREAGNPGVVRRNVEQKIAFRNAAVVEANSALDPAECYWPLELVS